MPTRPLRTATYSNSTRLVRGSDSFPRAVPRRTRPRRCRCTWSDAVQARAQASAEPAAEQPDLQHACRGAGAVQSALVAARAESVPMARVGVVASTVNEHLAALALAAIIVV